MERASRAVRHSCLAVALTASALSAQTPIRPLPSPVPTPSAPYVLVNPAGSWFIRSAEVSAPALGSGADALCGFRLSFGEGHDHQVSEIRASPTIPSGPGMLYAFHENDRDDYFLPHSWHVPLGGGARIGRAEKQDCVSRCVLTIERRRPGEVFVLRGFRFRRLEDRSNLRRLSLTPDPDNARVIVEFVDNGTFDYEASIDYAWVDGAVVSDRLPVTVTRSEGGDGRWVLQAARDPGTVALQGFSFEFGNGDHRIGDLAIVPSTEPGESWFRVRFSDQNTDDPYEVSIDYVTLR